MNSATNLTGVIRRLRATSTGTPTDGELLASYTRQGDELAFAMLVQRYGGLVLGVARRQLADHQQAEDVFQATFLALARSANKLAAKTPLANWLYTVALRQARKLRAHVYCREELERTAPPARAAEADPLATISGRELVQVIDDELARLPDKYRLPVLLCCVHGLSREKVAEQLGWSEGMVKGRLERGRRRLAERLAVRGLAPSIVILAPLAAVVVPSELLARTNTQALAPWSSAISPRVLALAALAAPHRLLPITVTACGLLVAGLVGWAMASVERSPKDPVPGAPPRPAIVEPVADRSDPLPEGAALRFGTSRYRQGTYINCMTVSSDGKLAAVTTWNHFHGVVRAFDLTNGRAIYTLGERQWAHAIAFSPDGKMLLTKATNKLLSPKIIISLIDAATGKELRKVELAETDDGTMSQWVTFTPDGKAVAMTKGNAHEVVLVDLEKGAVARTFPHDAVVYAAAISLDGTRMAAGGEDGGKGKYFTRLWEVAGGKELVRLAHGEGELRTIAFSPDGRTVAGGGDYGWARIWDVETGKEQRKFPKAGYRVQSVAFAPDGRTLAIASASSTGDAIRIYDLSTGDERVRINRSAICLRFSPDGKVLTGAVSGTIHQWDTTTGKPLTPQMAGESAVEQVLVTRDARRLITRHLGDDAQLWDATTGENLKVLKGTSQSAIALSPDSRYAVWPIRDEKIQFKDPRWPDSTFIGSRLRLYDITTDKFIERFERFGGYEEQAHELFFTPDGRTLLTVDHRDGTVRVWDFATGKEKRKFRVRCKDEAGIDYYVKKAVLSPDGKSLAVWYEAAHGLIMPYAVRLWDVATGTKKHELPGHYQLINLAFSPDSRFAVVSCEPLFERDLKQPYQIYVWDMATSNRTVPLADGLPTEVVAMAFADDGRTLATATPDGLVQLWEVASWTIRAEYRGHRGRVTSLTFASDGRLFTGGLDTTVLAWNLHPPIAAGPIDAAWEALTRPGSAEAFKAQGHLLAAPADAIRLIASKMKPAESADPKRLATLLAELDSPTFATREQASKRLAEIGRPALAALRDIAETTASFEVRRRATDLIEQIDGQTISTRELRECRAVEVLAWIGTAEAKELLAALAKGERSARLTAAADAALKRLKVRDADR
jgi:RNA polymerase sigma factor (sigma-70 family)